MANRKSVIEKKFDLVVKSFGHHNNLVHDFACDAVSHMSQHGDPVWLTRLHQAMPKLYQDALRAWLSTRAGLIQTEENEWIKYSNGNYTLVPDVPRLPVEAIEAIRLDMSKYMMNKTAKEAADQLSWDMEFMKKLNALVASVEKKSADGKNVMATEFSRIISEAKVNIQRRHEFFKQPVAAMNNAVNEVLNNAEPANQLAA